MRALPSCLRMVAPKAPLSLASRLISSGRALRKAPLSVLARGLSNIAGEGHFVGIRPGAKLVPECKILSPERDFPQFDIFSLLTEAGEPREGAALPLIEDSKLQRMYRAMVQLQEIDVVFMAAHRQGRISFYMTSTGEEASFVGSAAALGEGDVVFGQYRETGILLWRGFTVQDVADQLFGNDRSKCRGRSMPMLFGSKALNFFTMSAPLTTQVPHAVGAAFAMKGTGRCTIVYFGEGAASEGDFHGALNFAATLSCPVIFFCRNNGYAISTGTEEQYRGDGIASRAIGYGMHTIRVDGNDILAVHEATAAARAVAITNNCPVLVEAMSYRVGHHSTSDDSTAYRSVEEIDAWRHGRNPVTRFRSYLEAKGLWDDELEMEQRKSEKKGVLAALPAAERREKPPIETLFTDVYKEMPLHLKEQEQELLEHLKKYPEP